MGDNMFPNQSCCSCSCSGNTGPKLIFSCSGAADVGELSDKVARQLTREGTGKMYCLAGIGGQVDGILKTTETAKSILVIDGCPLDCGKNSLLKAGFKRIAQIRLTDLGFEKGKTDITKDNVQQVIERARFFL
jgi:uncharacterized metal-binding protein